MRPPGRPLPRAAQPRVHTPRSLDDRQAPRVPAPGAERHRNRVAIRSSGSVGLVPGRPGACRGRATGGRDRDSLRRSPPPRHPLPRTPTSPGTPTGNPRRDRERDREPATSREPVRPATRRHTLAGSATPNLRSFPAVTARARTSRVTDPEERGSPASAGTLAGVRRDPCWSCRDGTVTIDRRGFRVLSVSPDQERGPPTRPDFAHHRSGDIRRDRNGRRGA